MIGLGSDKNKPNWGIEHVSTKGDIIHEWTRFRIFGLASNRTMDKITYCREVRFRLFFWSLIFEDTYNISGGVLSFLCFYLRHQRGGPNTSSPGRNTFSWQKLFFDSVNFYHIIRDLLVTLLLSVIVQIPPLPFEFISMWYLPLYKKIVLFWLWEITWQWWASVLRCTCRELQSSK